MTGEVHCRYCPLYCPDLNLQRSGSQVYGHCIASLPPVPLLSSGVSNCPYGHDPVKIGLASNEKLRTRRDLRGIKYYACSEDGVTTPYAGTIEAVMEGINRKGVSYTLFVVYLDADRHIINKAVIRKFMS